MKPGPKTEPFLDGTRARTVSLDELTVRMAKAIDHEGNLSRGIRVAVRHAYEQYQRDRFNPGKPSGAPDAQTPDGLSPQKCPSPDA